MTKKIKKYPAQRLIIAVVVIVGCILIGGLLVQRFIATMPHYAKPVGTLKTDANETLQSNINTYMESKKSPYALGKDDYHCSTTLYGYDDKYAYGWVSCMGYIESANQQREPGSGFGTPIRVEYVLPGYRISSVQQPGDGSQYSPTLRKLFPEKFYNRAIGDTTK